jgi:hypothetical protein
LRNGGIEFLSRPLARTAVNRAIRSLWPYFGTGRIRPSVRTGVHIHASCLGLTLAQVKRILEVYALVEPVLFKYVGAEREENIYCVPWYRAPLEARAARDFINRVEETALAVASNTEDPCKYSALYVYPLCNFGTIEFRHAPTWTDADTMFRWWQMVQSVWRSHQGDYDVLERWRELGPVEFARSILPFDWLDMPDESAFWDADVDGVCARVRPPKQVMAAEWGYPPVLDYSGTVQPEEDVQAMLGEADIPVPDYSDREEEDEFDSPTTAPPTAFDRAIDEVMAAARRRVRQRGNVVINTPTTTTTTTLAGLNVSTMTYDQVVAGQFFSTDLNR